MNEDILKKSSDEATNSVDNSKKCNEVWLLEYSLREIQKGWSELQRSAVNVMLGETPHLAIEVYGREFEVERDGPCWIDCEYEKEARPKPKTRILLGKTHLKLDEIMEFYHSLTMNEFSPGTYDLLSNNCIHFAEVLSIKLVGKKLPDQYQLVVEKKAFRVGAIAVGAGVAVAGLCAAAATYYNKKKKIQKSEKTQLEEYDSGDCD